MTQAHAPPAADDRYCAACDRNVRPRPPTGLAGLAALAVLAPARWECPRCGGDRLRAPRALAA